jgi:hypothetical protein
MGGGLSKKAEASRQKAPPTHVNQFALPPDDAWEVERVRDDEWQSLPYELLRPPKHPVTPPRAHGPPPLFVPFDTPNGGAGVGSLRQRHLEEVTVGAELSEVPPTALCVEVLEVSGLNDTATPVGARARGTRALLRALRALHVLHALTARTARTARTACGRLRCAHGVARQGKQDTAVVYCVAIIGTVTRVLDRQQSEGLDKVKFYGSRATFPLHDRGEIELIGLPLQVSVFLSSVSPAEPDREVGECCVELEEKWLFGTEGHTAWLRLVSGFGGGSAGRVKVWIQPEFGRGTVLQQDEASILKSTVSSYLTWDIYYALTSQYFCHSRCCCRATSRACSTRSPTCRRCAPARSLLSRRRRMRTPC